MLRWLIVILLALVLIDGLGHWLRRFGLGRLPGDFNFRFLGRDWSLPLASALLLSLLANLIARLL